MNKRKAPTSDLESVVDASRSFLLKTSCAMEVHADTPDTEFESFLYQRRLSYTGQSKRLKLARLIRTKEDAKDVFKIIVGRLELRASGVKHPDGDAVGKLHLEKEQSSVEGFSFDGRRDMIRTYWETLWGTLDHWGDPDSMQDGMRSLIQDGAFPTLLDYLQALDDTSTEVDLSLSRSLLAALRHAWPGN